MAQLPGGGSGPFPESTITGLIADLAAKAALASPALTGTPTTPTAAALTNTTQIASTAYSDAAVAVEKARAWELHREQQERGRVARDHMEPGLKSRTFVPF